MELQLPVLQGEKHKHLLSLYTHLPGFAHCLHTLLSDWRPMLGPVYVEDILEPETCVFFMSSKDIGWYIDGH